MKRLLFLILFFAGINLAAQFPADALRFSSFQVGGTARTVAIGGGIGALGADFSVISTNPAGVATFRRSEFTMTPSLFLNNTDATLDNAINPVSESESRFNFNFNNLGLVFSRSPRNPNWTTSNVAIGVNRIANFNQNIRFSGSSTGSFIDFFQEQAGTLLAEELSDFSTGLAFDVGALYQDPLEGTDFWETDVELNENALITKEQTINRRGSINELAFAMGWNYKERLMLGFTVGFPILSYTEDKIYREEDLNDEVPAFRSLQYDEMLTTSGAGVNLKVGAIFRLNQQVRLGAAIHTPTTFALTDDFETRLQHDFVADGNDGILESASPESQFDYSLTTPWRFIGSAGFIYKKLGFISAEVEYVNFGSASFNLTEEDNSAGTVQFEEELNNDVARLYQSAINLRLGGEIAYNIMRIRAGINLQGAPTAGVNSTDATYSLGLGLRQRSFFFDFAYRFADREEPYFPYTVSDVFPQNSVSTNAIRNSLLFTFGFKF